ncbi:MAG: transposase [Microthrixaceae bacterium]
MRCATVHAANQRLGRAWELKEELVALFDTGWVHVGHAFNEWLAWASRSKLAPFVKLARTIRAFRTSIMATIEYGYTNGLAESNNASIGRIRANARGFHDPEAFIKMIMLDRVLPTPPLPWAA